MLIISKVFLQAVYQIVRSEVAETFHFGTVRCMYLLFQNCTDGWGLCFWMESCHENICDYVFL